ncbi:MAG TPA: hypothetical protein VFK05_10855 [Polyangiaceae bacterium]|nr:hypothetical protein [Polyangiaceae bacterium]
MTHKTLCLTFAGPLVLLAAIACKKQDEPAATAGYQAGTPGAAGAPATGVPVTPAPSAATPVVTAPPPAPSASAPVPVDPALAAAVTPMLTQLGASQTVAGSKPLGTALVGNVGGAQTLEQQITLQPNKCYSVVAAGMPPIGELNVQFLAVTVIPGMAPVLAIDQDTGPTATLGKKPNCYKWALPLPTPVKVVVSASAGQGLAGAQVYEK